MADIELVIKIPKELYNYIMTEGYDEHFDRRFDYQVRLAVKDGTPLPKGHGSLIDVDDVCITTVPSLDKEDEPFRYVSAFNLELAPIIIEADTENKK